MPAAGNCVCVLATNYKWVHDSSTPSFGFFRIFTRKMPKDFVLFCLGKKGNQFYFGELCTNLEIENAQ